MTAAEMIADLVAMGPQNADVVFLYLANHAIDARLEQGQRICDVSDVIAWLRELAEAAKIPDVAEKPQTSSLASGVAESRATAAAEFRTWAKTQPSAQPRWDQRCEDCFHVHTGRYECTEYLGEGRFCKCSSKAA